MKKRALSTNMTKISKNQQRKFKLENIRIKRAQSTKRQ